MFIITLQKPIFEYNDEDDTYFTVNNNFMNRDNINMEYINYSQKTCKQTTRQMVKTGVYAKFIPII